MSCPRSLSQCEISHTLLQTILFLIRHSRTELVLQEILNVIRTFLMLSDNSNESSNLQINYVGMNTKSSNNAIYHREEILK